MNQVFNAGINALTAGMSFANAADFFISRT